MAECRTSLLIIDISVTHTHSIYNNMFIIIFTI